MDAEAKPDPAERPQARSAEPAAAKRRTREPQRGKRREPANDSFTSVFHLFFQSRDESIQLQRHRAHGFGLAWYEQKRDGAGQPSFVEHLIMGDFATKNPGDVTFTELHALTMADVDGDGLKDIITGKRAWAHLDSYSDPDAQGAAVLYWFKTVRDAKAPGGARFVPDLIHNRSGVGSMIPSDSATALDTVAGSA